MLEITSPHNPKFKAARLLLDARGIKKSGQCLIFGEKVIRDYLKSQKPVEAIFVPESSAYAHIFLEDLKTENIVQLSSALFKELDIFKTSFPILWVPVPKISPWEPDAPTSGLELFCAMGDPGNLGAMVRSAKAFGVSSVVLLKECVHPFLPKVVRSSVGSVFSLPLQIGPSINDLAGEFVALDMTGENLFQFDWPKNLRLLSGEEGLGIPKGLDVKRLSIPMETGLESLNVMVATSIALSQHYQKTKKQY